MRASRRTGLLLLAAFVFGIGLFDYSAFCQRTRLLEPPASAKADAIVALTGGSGLRIAAGVDLIENEAAAHLLISGVHPDVNISDIATLGGGNPSTYQCCVELGYTAKTTYGNALETARWAQAAGHKSLLIVTSNYHMPRSLILLQRAMPDLQLLPYPVQTRINPATPYSNFKSAKGLVTEWLKWRVTRVMYGDTSNALKVPST